MPAGHSDVGVVGILLAAGRGKRFDPSGLQNKLLQPLPGGEPVVVASALHMLAVFGYVAAVVRPGDDAVAAALRALGCDVIVCADADSGMAASLVAAIAHTRLATGWLVALGDMPHVNPATISLLKSSIEQGADIAAPVYEGRRGNPVAFGTLHLPLLLALHGDQGARSILKQHPVHEITVADSGVVQDIDTRADLLSASGNERGTHEKNDQK
jgi:molybdenum cofactor cytidylyltransferase